MKGFKSVGKSFSFPTSADSSSRGSITQQLVRPHFRAKAIKVPGVPKFAKGGPVSKPNLPGDNGNALVQRSHPVTQFDAKAGGKGPLRTGYADGGHVESLRSKFGAQFTKKEAEAANRAKPHPKDTTAEIRKKIEKKLNPRSALGATVTAKEAKALSGYKKGGKAGC